MFVVRVFICSRAFAWYVFAYIYIFLFAVRERVHYFEPFTLD